MLASPASRFDSGTATALSHSDRMPIRERIKKTFSSRRKPSISSLSPLEQAVNTPLPASKSRSRTSKSSKSKSASDALYYLPGEKLPLKYRRPVEKEHRDKLAAFSWQQKMKRNSAASQYSPMGSRMPSREASLDDPQIRMFAGTGLDKPWPNAIQGVRNDSDLSTEEFKDIERSLWASNSETNSPRPDTIGITQIIAPKDIILALRHAKTSP